MIKTFKCTACKKIIERDVARNVIKYRSFCEVAGKDVVMKRIKNEKGA